MQKSNLLIKKLKKQFLSINDLIESYFNKIKYIKFRRKEFKLSKNNKVFLGIAIFITLSVSYLTLPVFYDSDIIESKLKNQIYKKYNIDLRFNKKLNYRLVPKPHFVFFDSLILNEENVIADVKKLKINIAINKFFSFNDVEIRDLIFDKTDFSFFKNDFLFFKNLLQTEPNENKIIIKNSNIFFKDNYDEVLFINKIFYSKFYYDSNKLENIFFSKNKIFNVPYKLTLKNDKFNKEIFAKIESKKIRLVVESLINYDDKVRKGLLEILSINNNISLNFEINKNSLSFISKNKRNSYKGLIDFKPFYFSANFNYEGLSSKNIQKKDSFFLDLIKSQIFDNKNLNSEIILSVKNITNIDELNSLILTIIVDEGDIKFIDSSIMWKNDLKIILNDSLLSYDNEEINLVGKLIFKFENVDNFYSSFQVKKNHKKKIKEVQLDFIYNLNMNKITFDNVKIDNVSNPNLEEYIQSFNKSEKRIFNKITFKNFVSNFFGAYAG
jgi:hypothetical protein